MTALKKDQGDRRKTGNDKRKRNVGSKESSLQISSRIKKSRKEVMVYKRSIPTSWSRGPERKRGKGPVTQVDKRRLTSSANSSNHSRKNFQQAEASIQERSIGQYNLRHVIQNQLSPDHPEEECRTKGTNTVQRKKIPGAQTLQQEESRLQAAVYSPKSSGAGTGAEEWTIKSSESKTKQSI
ncbi:hypothetical protein TNIN_438841 [Trichonephila inaurata madagascariensis]|uniref:Uncharacterized protein n=1 Tax=Trichonephila inaurata madagascariensis TaxID=2747483 RepID=A0A8X7C141_9ARAC|nr:hypothetical protein TNIN_438841 [Trichonephila inaurata madagascariensis]